jgi:tetratricopeptide (TPR) repeat protein
LVIAVRRPGPGGFRPEGNELPVHPLSHVRTEHLVWAATEASPLRHHDVSAVVARANGNPLFVHEILRLVAQTGSTAALPDSLDSVVGAEIDALAPTPRRVLRCASVLGQSFRDETLQLLLEGDGIDPGDTLTDDLAPFLEPAGEGRRRFRQALTRDVAYEGLAFRRRRQLHRAAGVVIEKLAAGQVDQVADLLAHHYGAAQDHEQAWHWAGLAAKRARGSYANVEAATHYEAALDAARRLPEVPDTEKAAMWTGLGDVREQLGMFGAALDAYGRAAQLVREDPLARARLALRSGRAREQMGVYTAALREIRAAARRLGPLDTELALRWRARLTAFEAVVRQGQELPSEALAVAGRAIEEASAAGERFALAQAYAVMDWALIVLGRADEAVFTAKALAIYEELGDLPRQASALNNLGAAAYFEGRWDVAGDYYERAREASRRSGNEALAAVAAMNQGEILVNQGHLDEAESMLLAADRVLRATGSDAAQFTSLQLGRVAMSRGDLAHAEQLLTHAQQDAAAIGRHGSALEAAIHLSACHLLRDDPGAALETLRRAQRAAKAEATLYDVQVAEIETRILARLELYEQARPVNEAGIAEARRQNLVYELALLLLAAAEVAERSGDDGGVPGPLAEATTLLEQLGCRVPERPVAQRAQRGSPAPK